MATSPIDPLRSQLLEITEDMSNRVTQLRDFASLPGNAWLAKGELEAIAQLTGDLESLLEEIKRADAELGYS